VKENVLMITSMPNREMHKVFVYARVYMAHAHTHTHTHSTFFLSLSPFISLYLSLSVSLYLSLFIRLHLSLFLSLFMICKVENKHTMQACLSRYLASIYS